MAQDVKVVISAENRASAAIAQATSQLQSLSNVSNTVSRSLATLGVSLSIGGVVAWTRATINGLDALNDLKDATGSSIENISALEDVARRTGTSFDTVGTALVKFNAAIKDAKPDSDAEQAFRALGLSLEELRRLDPAEALLKTAVALQGFADDGNKARLVQELFGKSLREVAPLLKDLAEKGQLNATVTSAQAAEAEKFNNQLASLAKNSQDAARGLVGGLLPSLNAAIERFVLARKHAGGFFETLALYFRLDYSKNIQGNLDEIEGQLADLEDRLRRTTSEGGRQGVQKLIQDLRNQANYLKDLRVLKATADLEDAGDAISRRRGRAERPSLPSIGGKDQKAKAGPTIPTDREELSAYATALNELQRIASDASAKTDGLSKTQAALRDIMASPVWAGYNRQQREQIGYAASLAQAEEDRAAATEAATKSAKARQDARNAEADGIRQFIAETESAAFAQARNTEDAATLAQAEFDAYAKTKSQLAELTLARLRDQQAGLTAGTALYEALQRQIAAQEKLAGILKKGEERDAAEEAAKKAAEAWQRTADGINQSLTDALMRGFESGKDFGQNFADTLENMLKTAILRPLISKTLDPVSQFITRGLDQLLSFEGGGYTGSGIRSGGMDGRGGFLAMLHPDETVTDHRSASASGSPVQPITVVQNFTVGDVASLSDVRAAVANSERRIAAGIHRSMAYGGAA